MSRAHQFTEEDEKRRVLENGTCPHRICMHVYRPVCAGVGVLKESGRCAGLLAGLDQGCAYTTSHFVTTWIRGACMCMQILGAVRWVGGPEPSVRGAGGSTEGVCEGAGMHAHVRMHALVYT